MEEAGGSTTKSNDLLLYLLHKYIYEDDGPGTFQCLHALEWNGYDGFEYCERDIEIRKSRLKILLLDDNSNEEMNEEMRAWASLEKSKVPLNPAGYMHPLYYAIGIRSMEALACILEYPSIDVNELVNMECDRVDAFHTNRHHLPYDSPGQLQTPLEFLGVEYGADEEDRKHYCQCLCTLINAGADPIEQAFSVRLLKEMYANRLQADPARFVLLSPLQQYADLSPFLSMVCGLQPDCGISVDIIEGIVTLLLEKGANPNHTNREGMTPLFHAISGGIASCLIKFGADVNKVHEISGDTPLLYQLCYPEVCNSAVPDDDKKSIIDVLLRNGANVSEQNKEGNSCLSYAHSEPIFRTLVEAGADLQLADENGLPPFLQCVAYEKWSHYEKIEKWSRLNIFFSVCPNEDFPSQCDPRGWTALHWASFRGDTEIIKRLLEPRRGKIGQYNHQSAFDVRARDRLGYTPLHVWGLSLPGWTFPLEHWEHPADMVKSVIHHRNGWQQWDGEPASIEGLDLLLKHNADPRDEGNDGSLAFFYLANVADGPPLLNALYDVLRNAAAKGLFG